MLTEYKLSTKEGWPKGKEERKEGGREDEERKKISDRI